MGWWETEDNMLIGDGPLDIAEEFFKLIAKEYTDDLNRQPSLVELLKTLGLVLEKSADEFTHDCDNIIVTKLTAKTRKRPKKQKVKPGDIFEVPLGDGEFAFGRVTPQSGICDFYDVKSRCRLSFRELRECGVVKIPVWIDADCLENNRWKVFGNIPYEKDGYQVQHLLIGNQITCSEQIDDDGFIHPDAKLRRATEKELKTTPKNGMCSFQYFEDELRKRLSLKMKG